MGHDRLLLQRDILIALRGRPSANNLNSMMCFPAHKVHRLENGSTALRWKEMLAIASACGRDVGSLLREIFGYVGPMQATSKFLRVCLPHLPIPELSRRTGISRHKLTRWLSGDVDPTVDEMINLLELFAFGAHEFLTRLCKPGKLPTLDKYAAATKSEIMVYRRFPEAAVVVRGLKIEKYKKLKHHEDKVLASSLGLSVKRVSTIIAALAKAGVINLENGIYRAVNSTLYVSDIEAALKARLYRAKTIDNHYARKSRPNKRTCIGVNVFAVNDRLYKDIIERYLAFYASINDLARNEKDPCDDVMVMDISFMSSREVSHYSAISN